MPGAKLPQKVKTSCQVSYSGPKGSLHAEKENARKAQWVALMTQTSSIDAVLLAAQSRTNSGETALRVLSSSGIIPELPTLIPWSTDWADV